MVTETLTVLVSLLGVIGLIFLTYLGTKWLNKKFRFGGLYGTANGIKIVECIGIAQDRQLMIVRAGKKLMLLGVTPGSVAKICDLDEDDLVDLSEPQAVNTGFLSSFKKVFAEKNRALGNEGLDENYSAEKDGQVGENDF